MSFTEASLSRKPRVLVAASDDARTAIVETFDEEFPYEVCGAATAAAALQTLDSSVVSVVATASLPDGSGLSLADEVGDVDEAPPVILLTETVDGTQVAEMGKRGATALPMAELDALPETVETYASTHVDYWEAQEKLAAISQLHETLNYSVFIKDTDARHLYLSKTVEMPNPSVAIGKTDDEIHSDRFDIGKRWYENDLEVLESGDPIRQRTAEYSDGDGNSFYNEVSVVPWRDDDETVRGVVGMRQEISDEVIEKQEMERKIRRLDQFVRNVSHDLKNPLQVAHGSLTLARGGDDAALDNVSDALERMEELIDDVEKLARSERKEATETSAVPFVDLVHTVWSIVGQEETTLQIDVPEGTIINAEKAEFGPMIENLLKNAVDHGPEDVTVTVGALNDGFYVEDDGPGIPAEIEATMFEDGVTTSVDGHGVGLAIVSDIAAAHDWTLDVTESSNGGARFTVRNCLMGTESSQEPTDAQRVKLTENVDVGEPEIPGRARFDEASGEWHVTSAGADIYGHENEFHYGYTTIEGPTRITGRVSEVEKINQFSKAGLMVRDSLDEDSVHAYVGRTPDWGTELLWRTEPDTKTVSQHLTESHDDFEWFRIDRRGTLVTCWVSHDGEEWQLVDQRSVQFSEPVHVGIVACSVIPQNAGTAVFEDVSVQTLEFDE